MPMDFLHAIEHMEFPLRVDEPRSLRCIAVLKAAGLIRATSTCSDVPGVDSWAVVEAITTEGRVALARYAQGKPFA